MTVFHALKMLVNTIIHNCYCEYICGIFNKKEIQFDGQKDKRIYFLMTPNYGNIGDQAIACASMQFLEDNYKEYQIIEIPINLTCRYLYTVKSYINHNDIVFLQGGGNMGNLYRDIDNIRNFVLKILKQNRIISFPITACFSDDIRGKYALWRNKRIYKKCKNLTLIAREEISYEFLVNKFSHCKIMLCPDMVFYLSLCKSEDIPRNNILICLRQDFESNLGERRNQICKEIFSHFTEAYLFDTTVDRNITNERRLMEVESLLRELTLAKVIVTDRMHGMILAAITGTPCIVFEDKNHKIRGSYEWVREFGYIKLVSNDIEFSDIEKELIKLIDESNREKDIPNFWYLFEGLRQNYYAERFQD